MRGTFPWSVALGYYNDDAFVDVAVSNTFDSSFNIYLGIGNGSFGTSQLDSSTGSNSNPLSIMFGDFNNDNQQDIVVVNDSN